MIQLNEYNNSGYPSYKKVQKNFGSFLKKIIIDPEISDLEKKLCLKNICSIKAKTKQELEKKCLEYFNNNKLKGSLCKNVIKLNPFVRIHTKDAFISWVSQIIGLTPDQTKTKLSHLIYVTDTKIKDLLFNSFINCTAINDSYMIQENCLKFFGVKQWKSKSIPKLKDAYVSNYNYIQWSFPNPIKEDIFKNQTIIETLSCRAGLMDLNKKVVFLHKLDKKYNVKRPTVFDAGFYEQFEPGGKTKPLDKCKHLLGFDEFVHLPNNFFNIGANFYEIFNV